MASSPGSWSASPSVRQTTSREETPELLPEVITCVECGGRCHLLTPYEPGLRPEPGDIVAYRCEDCLDRWDVVIPDLEEPESPS